MPPRSPAQRIQEARRYIAAGRPAEAKAELAGLERESGVRALLATCHDLGLRKFLRQAKSDGFAAAAGGDPRYALALARMRGAGALAALAADAAMPVAERELAAWTVGDVRAGLMAMRKRPGWQALAEGWLLLLRGDGPRARASFIQARAAHPRRAALGEGVAAAVCGDLDTAERLLRDLGPFPQAVYPTAASLLRSLSRHAAGWHPGVLRQVLLTGGISEVERTLASCPGDRNQERAWLFLRLGDLRAAADPRSPRADEAWANAGGLSRDLLPDVLKRRFWRDLQNPLCDRTPHLARLHAHLAGASPEQAREALLTILGEVADAHLSRIQGPHRECRSAALAVQRLAPEWLLVWARCFCFALVLHLRDWEAVDGFHAQTGMPAPPESWKLWKPVIARLIAELPGERQVTTVRLGLLDCFRQTSELRKALFDAVMEAPERRDELLPRWCAVAVQDRRSRRSALAEAERLETLFAGDLRLVIAHLTLAEDDAGSRRSAPARARSAADRDARRPGGAAALRARLLPTLPNDHAAFLVWRCDGGPLPEGVPGRDDLVDRLLLGWTRTDRPDCLAELRRRLRADPVRFQRLLLELAAEDPPQALREAREWHRDQPRCWQALYTAGRLVGASSFLGFEQERLWSEALALAPAGAPETAEMRNLLDHHADAEPADNDQDDDDDDDGPAFAEMEAFFKAMAAGGLDAGFGKEEGAAPPRPRARRRRRGIPAPPPGPPPEPPIDLERVAAAAGCTGELELANLPRLCVLTRSEAGPGPLPAITPDLAVETATLIRLAPYLMQHIRDQAHRDWFDALVDHVSISCPDSRF